MLQTRNQRNSSPQQSNPLSLFFDDGFSRFFEGWDPDNSTRGWHPPVDIHEEGDRIVLAVELPGFKQEEITISLENGRLTVAGERTFDRSEGRDYHRLERYYGRFQRSFQLPPSVNTDRIEASLSDGILTLTAPKRDEARPRQITVTS